MRKQDIKPGVVYAYQEGKYQSPTPIVFLAAPKDTELWSAHRRPPEGAQRSKQANAGAKPYRSRGRYMSGGDTGYPAAQARAMPGDGSGYDMAALATVDLADFEAATDAPGPRCRFTVVTNLTYIAGEWETVTAEHAAAAQADRDHRAALQRERSALNKRAGAVQVALGVPIRWDGDRFILSLQSAEKLAALLNPEAGE